MPSMSVELRAASGGGPCQPLHAPQPPAAASRDGAADARAAGASAVEIQLPNGRVVRVPAGFAPEELERLLAIASGEGSR